MDPPPIRSAEMKIREKMRYALQQIDDQELYVAKKSYFKCWLPTGPEPDEYCGQVGTLSEILVHMSKHWDVTIGSCTHCLQNLYDVAEVYNHKVRNLPDVCKRAHYTHHKPTRFLAIMMWKAKNIFIKEISPAEYQAWKAKFAAKAVKSQSRAPTPTYNSETNNDGRPAPEEPDIYENPNVTSSTAAFYRYQQKKLQNSQQSEQSSSSGYPEHYNHQSPMTGPPGISQRVADPRAQITTTESDRRSQISRTEEQWNPTSSTPMATFNASFGQSQQQHNMFPNNSHPAPSPYATQSALSLHAHIDPRNRNTPTPTPQTTSTTPSYTTVIPGSQQHPSASVPQFRMMFNSNYNPMQQANPLQQIPLPSSAPIPVPSPQESRGGGRSLGDRSDREYNGPATRSRTPVRFDRDEATAAGQWRQNSRQHVAQGTASQLRITRSGSRPPDNTSSQTPPSQNTRRRQASVGRDASPVQQSSFSQRVAHGTAPPTSQPTRGRRQPSVGPGESPVQHPQSSQQVARGVAPPPPPQNIRRRQPSVGSGESPWQQPPSLQRVAQGTAPPTSQPARGRRNPSVGPGESPVQHPQSSQQVARGVAPPPPPQNIKRRQPSVGSGESPWQQPPSFQRVAQGTAPPTSQPARGRRNPSVGRDASPVQHPPSSQPVARGAAQPPPQNIRKRQASVGRLSVDEIAQTSGLTRSRPSRCPTPARESTPEPNKEQAEETSGKISLAICRPEELTRTRRSSVSYRSLSRGRSSSRPRDEEIRREDIEKLQKERELERSKGSKTVKVPPSNNRQFLLSNPPTMASNLPPVAPNPPPKISKTERLKQKIRIQSGLASNPQFGVVSQQPSTSNAYDQRGNQQPSTSNANNQRYNQGSSSAYPPDSFPVSARTRAASRGRTPSPSRSSSRSRSRSPSPFSNAPQNRNGNRRSASRGNYQSNHGHNQQSRRNDNYRQNNNYSRNNRRN